MHRVCFAVCLSLLTSCAVTQPTFLSNRQRVLRISCDIAVDKMVACFKTAGSICGPRGFVIYDWNGLPWKEPYPEPETLEDDPGLAANGLLIACRA